MPRLNPLPATRLAGPAVILCGTLLSPTSLKADTLTRYGDAARWGLPAAAAWLAWQQGDTAGLWMLGKGFAASSATTLALKQGVGRKRPDGSADDSFPSGHTTHAFAGAAFLQQRYGWQAGLPAYAAATLVGVSRLAADKHYAGDVLVGAAIGIGASYLFTAPLEGSGLFIQPSTPADGVGFTLVHAW